LSTPPGKTLEKWPPLGLLYIASNIRENRSDKVVVLDAFCEGLSRQQLVERMVKERPDIIGLNCSTHTFMEAIQSLHEAKSALPESKIVLGGYHATFASERILAEYGFVDYIIKGEAEHAMVQLLERLENGKSLEDVIGISYRQDGKIINNPLSLVSELDALPFPDRKLVSSIEYGYSFQGIPLTFGKFTTLSTSRGCPFRCTYCSCAAFSLRKWRPRSAENVVEELETVQEQGYKNCVIVDDNFTHNPKRTEDICDLILERKIDMQFYCEGRVDGASYELMKKMKRAGINVIYFGAESVDDKVLDYYKKHINPEKTKLAISNAKRAGMLVVASFIIGAPVETREAIQRTFDFIRSTRPHAVQVNVLDCLIGTSIWEELEKNNQVGKDDWKRNHRIYEYYKNGFGKEELETFVSEAYTNWLKGWWSKEGIADILRILYKNKTARRIVFSNLLNPTVKELIFKGVKVFDPPKEQGKLETAPDP
jgi:anaerobic magnesium-protoporphyrin IX monomethyl ester cyclase